MSRVRLPFAALVAIAAVLISCTDRPTPTGTASVLARRAGATSSCLAIGDLTNLVSTVFGSDGPNANSALAKLNTITRKLADGDTVAAQQHARDLISFIQQKATQLADLGQVQALIDAIECYAGLTSDAYLVMPLDNPQTIVTDDGQAGIELPGDPVTEPTLITVSMLPSTSSGVLDTKLDQYPGYVEIQQQSSVTNSLKYPVVVAVCPATSVPLEVRSRLRLGHQSSVTGFEVTPEADGSFLTCSAVASSGGKLPGLLSRLASLVLPKPLYARMRAAGGVGGTATEFSPFGPVDTELSFRGGVGGTATEFQRAPEPAASDRNGTESAVQRRRTRSATEQAVLFTTAVGCNEAVVGTPLSAECRPVITLTTHNGTVLQNVPITWDIGEGGGQVATDNPFGDANDCSAFGATASSTTNANGRMRACWTLGVEAGVNTLIATPHIGGDVPAGVTFAPTTQTFTATALKDAAVLAWSGLTQTYTGSPLSATVSTTPAGLNTVSITYDGSATAPSDAGSYAVVATLDNPSYEGTASGTLVINKAQQVPLNIAPLGAPAVYGSSIPLATSGGSGSGLITYGGSGACSASGSTLTITIGTGTCTITATKSGGNNYDDASATLSVPAIRAEQESLEITGIVPITYGGSDVALSTTGGNGTGSVTFDAGSSTACTVTSAGVVHAVSGTGTCTITATKSADANYTAKSAAPEAVAISKASQTISFGALPTRTFGDASFAVSAAASSGLPVAFAASGSCTISAATVSITGAGSCTVTALQSGDGNYLPAASTAQTFTINQASTVITWANPATITLGTALSGTQLNATASTNGAFVYTPPAGTVLPAGTNTLSTSFTPASTNYAGNTKSVSIKVFYRQVGCFSSPIYSVMPDTKSYQRKGSNLQIKCQLTNAQGVGVMNAIGNLLVEDLGTSGSTPTGTPLSVPNAFKVSTSGNYAYGLDTSPSNFISLHFYRVTASWSDGSTTVGWFYIK